MMIQKALLAGAAAMLTLTSTAAEASDRYSQRPPVLVSPDLSAPWVMQLRGTSTRRSGVVAEQPRMLKRRSGESGLRHYVLPSKPDPMRTAAVPKPIKRAAPQMDPRFLPQQVEYGGPEEAGTIVIDTTQNYLYLVESGGKARRYGVGTGKPGFEWAGVHKVTRKAEWPDWRPPAEMIVREREKGRVLPAFLAGGPENPLGARAMYLGSTLYRIHGTNQPWTIGGAVSSGCIRMRNEDVIELYERVQIGATVKVI